MIYKNDYNKMIINIYIKINIMNLLFSYYQYNNLKYTICYTNNCRFYIHIIKTDCNNNEKITFILQNPCDNITDRLFIRSSILDEIIKRIDKKYITFINAIPIKSSNASMRNNIAITNEEYNFNKKITKMELLNNNYTILGMGQHLIEKNKKTHNIENLYINLFEEYFIYLLELKRHYNLSYKYVNKTLGYILYNNIKYKLPNHLSKRSFNKISNNNITYEDMFNKINTNQLNEYVN